MIATLNFTPSDKLYVKIIPKIGFSRVNNLRVDIVSSIAPGVVDPGFERQLAHCAM